MNASEPLMTCRKRMDDIKTEAAFRWPGTSLGAYLLTAQAVSGMEGARAWLRLWCGTWEPCPRHRPPVVCWWREGERQGAETPRYRVPLRATRGGPPRSSDEGPVMGLERGRRVIRVLVSNQLPRVDEPVSKPKLQVKDKPFDISKWKVFEAYKKVKANRERLESTRSRFSRLR